MKLELKGNYKIKFKMYRLKVAVNCIMIPWIVCIEDACGKSRS